MDGEKIPIGGRIIAVADTFLRVWEKGKIKNIIQKYNISSSSSAICSFCSTWIDVPEESKVNETFQCTVCQKKLQIVEKGKKIVVELA